MTTENFGKKRKIAIVGAGVSGLRVAHLVSKHLKDHVSSLVIFEKSDHVGGVLHHTMENGFLFEHGAQGVLSSKESFLKCVHELGLDPQILLPKEKRLKRYLMFKDKIQSLFPPFLILMRLLCEPFIKSLKKPRVNETIYQFFSRRFGKGFADRYVTALTYGIWAGGAKQILMRYSFPLLQQLECRYGSLAKAALWNVFKKRKKSALASFQSGMSCLPNALFNDLVCLCQKNKIHFEVRYNAKVNQIRQKEQKQFELHYQILKALHHDKFDLVVYAGQPWQEDQQMFIDSTGAETQNAWQVLKKIPTHSIAVVGLGGKTNGPCLNGFGALANSWSKDILGVLSIHSIYPDHVPTGSFLYRVMLGGQANPLIDQCTPDQCLAIAKQRLFDAHILDPQLTTFSFEKTVVWKHYIPLPTTHQDHVLTAVWQLEALHPGLFFAGNHLCGVAVADCLTQANKTFEKIKNHLESSWI